MAKFTKGVSGQKIQIWMLATLFFQFSEGTKVSEIKSWEETNDSLMLTDTNCTSGGWRFNHTDNY